MSAITLLFMNLTGDVTAPLLTKVESLRVPLRSPSVPKAELSGNSMLGLVAQTLFENDAKNTFNQFGLFNW